MKYCRLNLDVIVALILLAAFSLCWIPRAYLLSLTGATMISAGGLAVLLTAIVCHRVKLAHFATAWFLLTLCLAYFHYPAATLLQQAERITDLPKRINTEFRITEIVRHHEYQTLVATARLRDDLPEQRIYLRWQHTHPANLGERWKGELHLRVLSSRLNDGGFDRQQWYFAKGISAYATVKSAVKIADEFSLRQRWLQQALQQTEGLSAQGLLLALGFGERAWLDARHWQIYQRTNTAHLIAISGLHIGLAMLMGFGLVRIMQIMLPTRHIGPFLPLLGGLAMAWGYAELAGLSIPTFRALSALVVIGLFRFQRVYCTAWQMLLRVLALLLIADPLMLLSASFWLSVGAVAALIVWYQFIPLALLQWRGRSLEHSPLRKMRYVINLLHLQFGLLWLFSPILLLQFNAISLSGFAANLIAVPLFSLLLVPLVLFAVISRGAWNTWWAANELAQLITDWISPLQNHWLAVSDQNRLIFTALLSMLFGGALYGLARWRQKSAETMPFVLPRSRFPFQLNERAIAPPTLLRNAMIGSLVVAFCCLLCYVQARINRPLWHVQTLDVGQGLATLLVKDKHAILYDTGAGWRGGSMAKTEIIPYLQRQGIQIEKLILSHDDNDHAGGAADILQHYPKSELVSPSHKNYGEIHRTFCYRGRQWQWRGLTIRALWPPAPVERADNPDSCVLLVEDGRYRLLLTGDADIATENRFVTTLAHIDVLQVGHHGSKTSTGQTLLTQTRPKIALISSGRHNPWGFPHPDVMARLHAQQSAVYNTAVSGQIELAFYPAHLKIRPARTDFVPWYRGLIGLYGK
ncbi:DNA internalization-related competence protein ComEC/Rec2 [Necropsobacter massiliensis]|uniref:DNA internalization-related competence protein ComEC/Rec2 n=1 Tax=Necropsobacter massiliensis TaxID=1400001 RepID=UPI000595D324|nr:DNA internalization-related competence protein ComEC/Rec2 [Necropsobacter massiliensis]